MSRFSKRVAATVAAVVEAVAPATKPSRKGVGGRPRAGKEHLTNTHKKPWKAAGISERTWYRKRAEKRAAQAAK